MLPEGATPGQTGRDLLATVTGILQDYSTAGATEFILEWPDASTSARVAWMHWFADNHLVSEGFFRETPSAV